MMWKKHKLSKNKFNAKSVVVDGQKFHSTLEAAFYQKLMMLKKASAVSYFLQQVPIILTGGIKYRVDFLVFYPDGKYEYIEIKGVETPRFKMIKKMLAELYPEIDLIILKKGDF